MTIRFIVKKTQNWTADIFDETHFFTYEAFGDGGEYSTIDSWYVGYRPTQIRIVGTVGSGGVVTVTSVGEHILGDSTATSDLIIDLTYGGSGEEYDLRYIDLAGYSSITAIYFLGGSIGNIVTYTPIIWETSGGGTTISPDGMTIAKTTVSSVSDGRSNSSFTSSDGKIYLEYFIGQANNICAMGFIDASHDLNTVVGLDGEDFGIGVTVGTEEINVNGSNISISGAGTWASNDIMMIAADLANDKIWFGRNGSWVLSGDPVGGNNPTYTSAGLFSGVSLYPAVTLYDVTDQVFIASRRNEFIYVVPAGFTALAQI